MFSIIAPSHSSPLIHIPRRLSPMDGNSPAASNNSDQQRTASNTNAKRENEIFQVEIAIWQLALPLVFNSIDSPKYFTTTIGVVVALITSGRIFWKMTPMSIREMAVNFARRWLPTRSSTNDSLPTVQSPIPTVATGVAYDQNQLQTSPQNSRLDPAQLLSQIAQLQESSFLKFTEDIKDQVKLQLEENSRKLQGELTEIKEHVKLQLEENIRMLRGELVEVKQVKLQLAENLRKLQSELIEVEQVKSHLAEKLRMYNQVEDSEDEPGGGLRR